MKKKRIFYIYAICVIIAGCFLFIGIFSGDITQYKRIGTTNYYLVESMTESADGGLLSNLYFKDEIGFGESIKIKGYPKHIFWNENYIIVKCSDVYKNHIINYCIIKQVDNQRDAYHSFQEHNDSIEYKSAMSILGLDETKMNYTDDNIPWSLHLFE